MLRFPPRRGTAKRKIRLVSILVALYATELVLTCRDLTIAGNRGGKKLSPEPKTRQRVLTRLDKKSQGVATIVTHPPMDGGGGNRTRRILRQKSSGPPHFCGVEGREISYFGGATTSLRIFARVAPEIVGHRSIINESSIGCASFCASLRFSTSNSFDEFDVCSSLGAPTSLLFACLADDPVDVNPRGRFFGFVEPGSFRLAAGCLLGRLVPYLSPWAICRRSGMWRHKS